MAATASTPCLLVDCCMCCFAACVLSLSSMACTGSRKRSASCCLNLLAALLMSESLPSLCSGCPTTRASGRQCLINSEILSQSGLPWRALIVHRAVAVPVTLCPTAIPIRCVPKSKPSKVCKSMCPAWSWRRAGCSCYSFKHARYRWITG